MGEIIFSDDPDFERKRFNILPFFWNFFKRIESDEIPIKKIKIEMDALVKICSSAVAIRNLQYFINVSKNKKVKEMFEKKILELYVTPTHADERIQSDEQTKPDIKKERITDIDFIQGEITEIFETHIEPLNKIVEHNFKITKNGKTRQYSPFEYLNLVLEAHYLAADKSENINEKISALVNAESVLKRYIREYNLVGKAHDFSKIFDDLADQMNRLKVYKELGISTKVNEATNTENEMELTNTEKLKKELNNYGFFELDIITDLTKIKADKLIKFINSKELPYQIAMLDYLGFIKHLEQEHFPTKNELYKGIAEMLGKDSRSVKGNILVLNHKSKEDKSRYTAHLHKETVAKEYLNIK